MWAGGRSALRGVKPSVLCVAHYLQVFDTVIGSITIAVVNMLTPVFEQASIEGNLAMLKCDSVGICHRVAGTPDAAVPLRGQPLHRVT